MGYHTKIPIITDGLVFSVDAYNKKSYVSGDTTCYDLSNNNLEGNLDNGTGYEDDSFVLDGINDSITFGDFIDFGTGDFSLSFWIKKTDRSYGYIMDIGTNKGGFVIGPGTGNSAGLESFLLYGGSYLLRIQQQLGATSYPLNEWFNLTLVKGVTNIKLYINGSEIYDVAHNNSNFGAVEPLNFGKWGNNNYYFGGNISTSLIYNKALTTSQVKQNYNATKYRFIS